MSRGLIRGAALVFAMTAIAEAAVRGWDPETTFWQMLVTTVALAVYAITHDDRRLP